MFIVQIMDKILWAKCFQQYVINPIWNYNLIYFLLAN